MQQQLPLSRDERLAALQRLDPLEVGIGRRQWRNVFELLRQIEYCGGRSQNSFARVSVLAGRMMVAERTVQRAAAVAIEAGLLVRSARSHANGQGSNEWAVQWTKIAGLASKVEARETAFAELSPTPDELSPGGDELSPTPDELSPTPDELSPPIEINQRPLRDRPHKVDPSKVDHVFDLDSASDSGERVNRSSAFPDRPAASAIDWDRAVGLAVEIVSKLPGRPTRRDWELAVKVSALSASYGEAWLWDAVAAVQVVHPSNVWGYLWACWSDRARQDRRDFPRDLARLTLPIPATLHFALLNEPATSSPQPLAPSPL